MSEIKSYGAKQGVLTLSRLETRAMEGRTMKRCTGGLGLFLALSMIASNAIAGDPTTGDCLSASDASLASKNDHRLRDARAQLLVCAADSCPADVRAECARKVDEINAEIPTIVLEAKDPSGADLSAVSVTVDGIEVATRLEGTALSFDPGDHVFTFRTPGQPDLTKHIVVRQGEKDRRERIVLGTPLPVPAPLVGTPASANGSTNSNEPRSLGGKRTAAIVVAAVGVVGLGLGIGFGADALSKHNSAQKSCPGACADQTGVNQWHDATTAGTVSTVAIVTGAVLVAGGAALWFAGKNEGPRVGVGLGNIELRGTF